MTSIIDEIFQDPDILAVPEKTSLEPLPYYAQIAGRPGLGIFLESDSNMQTAPAAEQQSFAYVPGLKYERKSKAETIKTLQ